MTRGTCRNCDFTGSVRKDGLLPKHKANEFCDGEPAAPHSTWEVVR